MQINNIKAKKFVLPVYFLFVVLFLFASLSFNFVRDFIGNATLKYTVFFVVLAVAFLMLYKVAKYFEYDSDGSVLVIVNKGLLLSEYFSYRENRAEFPKEKLIYYKFNNYGFYKSLNLYIKSNGQKQKRLKFNVSLVSSRKVKYLKMSLDKVMKQNKAKR